jgi:hypothetical protein
VAVAVEDKALRERIYEKSMEKFDGVTNVLWMQLEDDSKLKLSGGWNKRIDAELGKGRKNAVVKGIGNIDAAIKKFEKTVGAPLHLFWMYPSQWDKKTTPLVAFLPFDQNPNTRTSIPVFDSKGNRFELDRNCTLAKQRPVIILNYNERTKINGETRLLALSGKTHEEATQNDTYHISAPSLNKSKSKQDVIQTPFPNARITNVNFNSLSITYPYNADEWGGGVEFQVDFFLFRNNEIFGTQNSYFLGNDMSNANAIYQWSIPITVPYDPPAVPGTDYWECKYWEDDGLFFFDDFIAAHSRTTIPLPLQTMSVAGTGAGDATFPAQGGTVSTTYYFGGFY